jgi:MAF protein
VLETARQKAAAVIHAWREESDERTERSGTERDILVAADTTVAVDQIRLGKPQDSDHARQMLRRLRGRSHVVYTGLVVHDLSNGAFRDGVQATTVTMRNYADAEIEAYLATGDPYDKAGGYAIQHPVFDPVLELKGCYLGVVGLSVCHLARLLQQLEVAPRVEMDALRLAHQGHPCLLLPHIGYAG